MSMSPNGEPCARDAGLQLRAGGVSGDPLFSPGCEVVHAAVENADRRDQLDEQKTPRDVFFPPSMETSCIPMT
ncbi:MAG: hypothetical protein IT514_14740 [Burkholderiales bacterium]|nr:hypothetical protein [Burkholderiales bacterium]